MQVVLHYLLDCRHPELREDQEVISLETYHAWGKSNVSWFLSFWLYSVTPSFMSSAHWVYSQNLVHRTLEKRVCPSSLFVILTYFEKIHKYPYTIVIGFFAARYCCVQLVTNYFIRCFNVSMSLRWSYSLLYFRLTLISDIQLIDATKKYLSSTVFSSLVSCFTSSLSTEP